MSAVDFLGRHWESAIQLGVTAWLASITRNFQTSLSLHRTRLDTHQEAIRRARIMWWLQKEDADWMAVLNGMTDWLAINEVFLSPAASDAFRAVKRWKSDILLNAAYGSTELHPKAERALEVLSRELLRFRELTLRETIAERWRRFRRERRP